LYGSTGEVIVNKGDTAGKYLRLSGTLYGKAYATSKSTLSSVAIKSLKEDLIKSLDIGIELTLEDLESSGKIV